MIRTGIGIFCAAIVLSSAGAALPQAASAPGVSSFVSGDPLEGRRIERMTVLGDDLWLCLDGGALISIDLKDAGRRVEAEAGVLDIERRGDQLFLLTSAGSDLRIEAIEGGRRKTITRLQRPKASRSSAVYGAKGRLVVVSEVFTTVDGVAWRGAPIVQVYDERRARWRTTAVSLPAELNDKDSRAWMRWTFGRSNAAATRDGKSYYIGANRGEWGGDLYRIDLADGVMRSLPLGDDNNVQDIQQDPGRDDCVIVSTGLAHMGGLEGSIRRVCPQETSLLVSHPATSGLGIPGSAPVYRAIPLKAGYWFMSERGAFETDERSGEVRPATSSYAQFGGLMIDRSRPELVLVKYDAVSPPPDRYYPLVAPR